MEAGVTVRSIQLREEMQQDQEPAGSRARMRNLRTQKRRSPTDKYKITLGFKMVIG